MHQPGLGRTCSALPRPQLDLGGSQSPTHRSQPLRAPLWEKAAQAGPLAALGSNPGVSTIKLHTVGKLSLGPLWETWGGGRGLIPAATPTWLDMVDPTQRLQRLQMRPL